MSTGPRYQARLISKWTVIPAVQAVVIDTMRPMEDSKVGFYVIAAVEDIKIGGKIADALNARAVQ